MELLQDSSVWYTAVWANTDKRQVSAGASAPAARMKDGNSFLVVERDKAVKACPSKKALSIGTADSITPVDM